MNRHEALALWKQYNSEDHLLRHALAVEGAMRAYAKRYDQDIELWGICGLLHDIDFEKYPQSTQTKAWKYFKKSDWNRN